MTSGRLLDRGEAVLVAIDVQDKLLPAIEGGEAVLASIVKLVRLAEIVGLPIIVTEQLKLGDTVPEIRAVLPDMQPIGKVAFSCFGSEEFAQAVRELGRRTLVLTGIEAHICVAQTALAALGDYGVHVVSDAVGSRSRHNWKVALRRMEQAGATITSTEMLMYELLREAGTDEFRAVLRLVKGS